MALSYVLGLCPCRWHGTGRPANNHHRSQGAAQLVRHADPQTEIVAITGLPLRRTLDASQGWPREIVLEALAQETLEEKKAETPRGPTLHEGAPLRYQARAQTL